MLAYHNDPAIKAKILAQLQLHREHDQLVKGQYWENGKGCAVGCTVHSGNHAKYEARFGIPQVLARLEDRLFEGLPNRLAMEWPQRFMSAIRPGADLSMIWPRFALWLCTDELSQYTTAFPQATKAIEDVAALYRAWIDATYAAHPAAAAARPGAAAARAAGAAARAAGAAAYAVVDATYAAGAAGDATYAAAYAAGAAAGAAGAAAYAAAYAVVDATRAAGATYAAAYAAGAANERMANKLIELLEAA